MPPADDTTDTDWLDDKRLEEAFAAWAATRTADDSRSQAEALEALTERREPGGGEDAAADWGGESPEVAGEARPRWTPADDEILPAAGTKRRRWFGRKG